MQQQRQTEQQQQQQQQNNNNNNNNSTTYSIIPLQARVGEENFQLLLISIIIIITVFITVVGYSRGDRHPPNPT